ncbi:Protocadherin gamma-B1 [Pteropus alecto]|uniref:Protocadherin gamma-B1 n=3 Tax=Pteropus alecto TaxID=9402 RepID=L5JU43_PTEAL|nr:Protocadherin gamma-B1 [Pteropus alecto]
MAQGTSALRVKATNQDEGINAEITYAFLNAPTSSSLLFNLSPYIGDITTNGTLDFEETSRYMLAIEAKDGGVHMARCNVEIDIVDENNSAPEVTFTSFSKWIPEDTDPGTIIALIKV